MSTKAQDKTSRSAPNNAVEVPSSGKESSPAMAAPSKPSAKDDDKPVAADVVVGEQTTPAWAIELADSLKHLGSCVKGIEARMTSMEANVASMRVAIESTLRSQHQSSAALREALDETRELMRDEAKQHASRHEKQRNDTWGLRKLLLRAEASLGGVEQGVGQGFAALQQLNEGVLDALRALVHDVRAQRSAAAGAADAKETEESVGGVATRSGDERDTNGATSCTGRANGEGNVGQAGTSRSAAAEARRHPTPPRNNASPDANRHLGPEATGSASPGETDVATAVSAVEYVTDGEPRRRGRRGGGGGGGRGGGRGGGPRGAGPRGGRGGGGGGRTNTNTDASMAALANAAAAAAPPPPPVMQHSVL